VQAEPAAMAPAVATGVSTAEVEVAEGAGDWTGTTVAVLSATGEAAAVSGVDGAVVGDGDGVGVGVAVAEGWALPRLAGSSAKAPPATEVGVD